jgi:hypothetical protein
MDDLFVGDMNIVYNYFLKAVVLQIYQSLLFCSISAQVNTCLKTNLTLLTCICVIPISYVNVSRHLHNVSVNSLCLAVLPNSVFGLVFLVLCTICCQFLWIFFFFIAPSVFSNVYQSQVCCIDTLQYMSDDNRAVVSCIITISRT